MIEQIDRGIAEGQAIELQASPHDVGQLAWLYDRVHKRDFVLVEGAPFAIAGLAGMVQAVGKDFVLLEIDGQPRRLEFSQNLRQLKATP